VQRVFHFPIWFFWFALNSRHLNSLFYETYLLHNILVLLWKCRGSKKCLWLLSIELCCICSIKLAFAPIVAPSPARDVAVESKYPGELHVSWKPPASPNGNVTHYYVYWQPQPLPTHKFKQRDYCKDSELFEFTVCCTMFNFFSLWRKCMFIFCANVCSCESVL